MLACLRWLNMLGPKCQSRWSVDYWMINTLPGIYYLMDCHSAICPVYLQIVKLTKDVVKISKRSTYRLSTNAFTFCAFLLNGNSRVSSSAYHLLVSITKQRTTNSKWKYKVKIKQQMTCVILNQGTWGNLNDDKYEKE